MDNAATHLTIVCVSEEYDGQRLDKYVATVADHLSRTRAQQLITSGEITVNHRSAKASYPVESNDLIAIPVDYSIPQNVPEPEAIPLSIAFEDEYLLIIDKPAGMVVHPAPGHSHGTLVNALLAYSIALGNAQTMRPGIVHRLDKDTSGLIIVAKDDLTLIALANMMHDRQFTKEYLALVEGVVSTPAGVIMAPIGRDPRNRQRMAILHQGGRESTSRFAIHTTFDKRTLLRVTLVTGRTHQIRVHCASIGHPVAGDAIYGRKQLPMPPRQFLHAEHLVFSHPITGQTVDITSPLPQDLAGFLESSMRVHPSQ